MSKSNESNYLKLLKSVGIVSVGAVVLALYATFVHWYREGDTEYFETILPKSKCPEIKKQCVSFENRFSHHKPGLNLFEDE